MDIIHTKKLTKRFGDIKAVDGVSLDIKEGEVFGLLGPNGAGKTTFISMLCTLIKPTSGEAEVAGHDVRADSLNVRKSIGIVFQEPSVDDLLTGKENLELHAMLYNMDPALGKKRVKEMLELVELTDRADSLVRTYSGGMRRRLEIARGLMHNPRVLFLDEPTLGLDPKGRKHVWDHIQALAKRGKTTIVLTTHYMEEADMLCDRVAIIDDGKIVIQGSTTELKRKIGEDVVRLKGKVDINKLKRLKFVKRVSKRGDVIDVALMESAQNLQKLLGACGKIDSVEVRGVTLDDVFLHYTGHKIHDEQGEDNWFERVANQMSSGNRG